jgi:TonB-dependent receptor
VANTPGSPVALGGSAGGTAGDVTLKPLVSDNIDLSLEWYFAPSSYVSVGFFRKSVKNFVGTGVIQRSLYGLRDPSSGAPGSRSGIALDVLQDGFLGITPDLSEENLFTMTALLTQYGTDPAGIALAQQDFATNWVGAENRLDTTFVNEIVSEFDLVGDPNDPLFQFAVQQPLNRNGKIHGFEVQGQYFFGETGFGVQAGYTRVIGDVNVDIAADPGVDQFALLGLSDSYNVTGIYEKAGLSARVTYNWRDKYLTQVNRGGFDRNPVFVEPFGTLDFNVSYDVTPQIAVSLEVLNALSEPIRTHGRTKRQLWFVQELKPRILLGTRFRF